MPEPERPITTNTSPGHTSSDTSLTAATQPVVARSSARESSASAEPGIFSAPGPNTFHTPDASISGVPVRSISGRAAAAATLTIGSRALGSTARAVIYHCGAPASTRAASLPPVGPFHASRRDGRQEPG